jgi:tetratricopeptide (TPR) repeat protein
MSLISWFKTTMTFDQAWRKPFNRGWIASGKGDWDQAIAEYSEAICINPHVAESFFNRAINYSHKMEWENTIADCTETIRLKPNHLKAYHWRGVAKRALAKYEAALVDFEKALALRPNDARCYYDRGVTYRLASDLPNAIVNFSKAIELGLNAFAERGYLQARLGYYDLAIADVIEARHRTTNTAASYIYQGWISYQQKDIEAAILNLGEAIRLEPEIASHY